MVHHGKNAWGLPYKPHCSLVALKEISDISGQYARELYVVAQDDQTVTEIQCS